MFPLISSELHSAPAAILTSSVAAAVMETLPPLVTVISPEKILSSEDSFTSELPVSIVVVPETLTVSVMSDALAPVVNAIFS